MTDYCVINLNFHDSTNPVTQTLDRIIQVAGHPLMVVHLPVLLTKKNGSWGVIFLVFKSATSLSSFAVQEVHFPTF